jgi:ubiquinone/menaquinone biosynthesis C-methylase UbiE
VEHKDCKVLASGRVAVPCNMTSPIDYWNGLAGARWVREQAHLDEMLQPFGDAALAAARVTPGEAALDLGCGCGHTSLALATLVGSNGRVVGIDVSAPMLERAKERGAGRFNLSFIEGDASREPLESGTFDLLFSRFGVMFFPDAAFAFTHLRAALRPHGRMAFACWQPPKENPWATVPFEAVAHALGEPAPQTDDASGPFSFGDAARVRRILADAGFRDVNLRSFEATNVFGASGSIDDAVNEIARLGPVARLLVDRDDASVARALASIKAVLPPYKSAEGAVRFRAAAWIVTAGNAASLTE